MWIQILGKFYRDTFHLLDRWVAAITFIATASSQLNNNYKASNAFNYYTGRRGTGGEWVSNNETRDFWIQVKCPELVRIWKIALRGRETNTHRIYRWRLEAFTDGENFFDAVSSAESDLSWK